MCCCFGGNEIQFVCFSAKSFQIHFNLFFYRFFPPLSFFTFFVPSRSFFMYTLFCIHVAMITFAGIRCFSSEKKIIISYNRLTLSTKRKSFYWKQLTSMIAFIWLIYRFLFFALSFGRLYERTWYSANVAAYILFFNFFDLKIILECLRTEMENRIKIMISTRYRKNS